MYSKRLATTGRQLKQASGLIHLAGKKKCHWLVSDASLLLSDIYSKTSREDLAYRYLREHMQLKDSISSDEFLKQVTRMEIQYDFDKKEKTAEFAREQERE